MKKNYTKPLFAKTLYISIDMMADTTEETSIMNSFEAASSSYSWFENADTKIKLIEEGFESCTCENCPDDTHYQCDNCSC